MSARCSARGRAAIGTISTMLRTACPISRSVALLSATGSTAADRALQHLWRKAFISKNSGWSDKYLEDLCGTQFASCKAQYLSHVSSPNNNDRALGRDHQKAIKQVWRSVGQRSHDVLGPASTCCQSWHTHS